jgi:uncharacterized protein (TIGR02145 family)
MKSVMVILVLLLAGIMTAYSIYIPPNDGLIKFYMNDGSPTQTFNIADIEKMAVKSLSNNYGMKVFYQKALVRGYLVSDIDSMSFVNNPNKILNIEVRRNTKSYLISDIDSIIFLPIDSYSSVDIGGQIWMTRNLDVSTYLNGEPIPQVTDSSQWPKLKTGAWCYYNNDSTLGKVYGKLYNWYAVNDPRGLAPLGWHIPTENELITLSTYLGGDSLAGGEMKETGTSHWESPNTGATNSSFFSALPSGSRAYDYGVFYGLGLNGSWWFNSDIDASNACTSYIEFNFAFIGRAVSYVSKSSGYSVRCVRY